MGIKNTEHLYMFRISMYFRLLSDVLIRFQIVNDFLNGVLCQ